MNISSLRSIIHHKQYEQPTFLQNRQSITHFFETINHLCIDDEAFKFMRIVVRFFGLSALVLMRPLLERITREKVEVERHNRNDLIFLGTTTMNLIEDRHFPLLEQCLDFPHDPQTVMESRLKSQRKKHIFADFLSKIDQSVYETLRNKDERGSKQIIRSIRQFQKQHPVTLYEKMSFQAYQSRFTSSSVQIVLDHPKIERQDSKKSINKRLNNSQIIFTQSILVQPQPSRVEKEKIEQIFSHKFYNYKQIVPLKVSPTVRFSNFSIHFSQQEEQKLLQIIVAFLNYEGGSIYFGFKQNQNNESIAVGLKCSVNEKSEIKSTFYRLCSRISPELNKSMILVEFIPIRKGLKRIQNLFILRLCIKKGEKSEFYCYSTLEGSKFAIIEGENIKIERMGQRLLEIFRQRLEDEEIISKSSRINHKQQQILNDSKIDSLSSTNAQFDDQYYQKQVKLNILPSQINPYLNIQPYDGQDHTPFGRCSVLYIIKMQDNRPFLKKFKQQICQEKLFFCPQTDEQSSQLVSSLNCVGLLFKRANRIITARLQILPLIKQSLKIHKITFKSIDAQSIYFSSLQNLADACALLHKEYLPYAFP